MILNGYEALHQGVALLELEGRGVLTASGEDRARLLHAMTTNHVQEMQPGDVRYVFFLNAQGRVLADAQLICREDVFLIDTEPERREFLFQHLDKFIIADDVTVEDQSANHAVFALEGPGAAALLQHIGADAPEPGKWTLWQACLIAGASVTGAPGFRVYAPIEERRSLRRWLAGSGAMEATAEDFREVRLENARPRYGEEITAAQIPHETRILHALHFNKGCYLGQEIVERVRSRGHVNRVLAQLLIAGESAPPKGTKITADSSEIGEIASSAFSRALGKVVALAYIRAEHSAAGAQLAVEGNAAEVSARVPG